MPELQIPKNPLGKRCDRCEHWLKAQAQNMAYLPNQGGLAPVAAMVAQGQSTAGLITARMGPCTRFPTWSPTPAQHWCHEYSFGVSNVVKMNGDDNE